MSVSSVTASDPDEGADTLTLAQALIRCRSVTPHDGGALALVEARLSRRGFTSERFDRNRVGNLWSTRGSGPPLVCLAGHVDVVPEGPRDRWSVDPFAAVVQDGWLIGRGSADMKASVAAMVTALERTCASGGPARGTIALLLTSDEEGEAVDGTAAVVEALCARGIRIDFCLLGEPTSAARFGDTIKNGRRGSLTGRLVVKGVQGHVAYAERALNPIHAAAPALAELTTTAWDLGDDSFGPTTFQIVDIHAGSGATNVIPDRLEVQFNVRFSPASPAPALRQRIEHVLRRRGVEFEIDWTVSADPFITPNGRLIETVRQAIAQVVSVEAQVSTSGGTSDGRFLKAIARELVEFGPSHATIHQIDERLAVADLVSLTRIYERVVRSLLETGEETGRS